MSNYNYDLIVIGSGPGGYVAAIRASQLGFSVAIIEKDKPGGVCLNIGCIPSKALIHQAELYHAIPDLVKLGIKIDTSSFNYKNVFDKSRAAADTLSNGVQFLLKKNKITYINGTAEITGKNEITADKKNKYSSQYILIATGSRPSTIPGFEIDEKQIISSNGALMLEKLPKSMVILGSGAIGVEFAHVFSTFGVEIHIVELLEHLLPIEDHEIVEVLVRSFRKRGIQMYTSTKALSAKKTKDKVSVEIEDNKGKKSILDCETLLVAVGRRPNTENIGLEKVGIKTEKGFIPVGDYYQTSVPNIFAIGDVVNTPLLAHVASKEGEIAVEFMKGHHVETKIDLNAIPSAVYCEPQIASFGYNEEKAKKAGIKYKKALFPYRGAGKSVAIEQPDGLVKVIYNPDTKELLGANIVGAEATELLHELLLAKTAELLPEDLSKMIHAHPTLSESVMESMRVVDNWAIHI